MRVSTGSLDHGHDVCGAQAAVNWAEGRSVSLHVLHRSQGVRHRQSHPPVAGPHSHRSTTAYYSNHLKIPRWDEELVCDLMTASVRIGSRWSKDYGSDACYPRCCSTSSFAVVLTVVLQRFSEDAIIFAELMHLKEPPTSMGPEPAMDYVRGEVRGMLYADDACIVSRSARGLAKMMEVIVEVCRAFALTVSAKKTHHVHASTVYIADDGASQSSRGNLQTGAILHLPRGCRDRNPGHVR